MTRPAKGKPMITRRTWLAAALTTAATACNLSRHTPARSDEPNPALTDAQRRALRAVMAEAIARREIPGGSLLVLARGKVVFREAFGLADLEQRRPFTTELPCFIASLSKPITATLFVMLDEKGIVSLDDPVEKFLPDFKGIRVQGQDAPAAPPRVWHLLSHRSGLPGNSDKGAVRGYRYARKSPEQAAEGQTEAASGETAFGENASLADIVVRWARDGLLAKPGTRFAYGSSGYLVAARIAEVATGKRYDVLLKQWLLDALGMTRTTFRPDAETLQLLPRRYLRTKAGLEEEKSSYPLLAPDSLVNPAGGLFSTLDELGSFFMLHLNGGLVAGKRLLAARSLARMYQPCLAPQGTALSQRPYGRSGQEGPYGLGWNIISSAGQVRHLGGSGTMGWVDLPRQNAGVLLTQVPWNGNHQLIPRLMKEVQSLFPLPLDPAKTAAGK